MIDSLEGVATSHGQGTLYILTGKYDKYRDVTGRFLGQRFEAKVPTIFEYLRNAYRVPSHETLIVNGEDRTHEEFYSFSNHHLFGANFRSNALSLYRFKTYLLRRQIAEGEVSEKKLAQLEKELANLRRSITGREGRTGRVRNLRSSGVNAPGFRSSRAR